MKFETPVVDVKMFELVDVLTTSADAQVAPGELLPELCGDIATTEPGICAD